MSIAVAAIVGALTWSFLEYVIHRWLGHDRRFRGNPFGVEHIRHHAEGGYFAPNKKKAWSRWHSLPCSPRRPGCSAAPSAQRMYWA